MGYQRRVHGEFPSKPSADNMFKVALASALVAVSFAAGPPAYGAPPPVLYKEEKLPPQPFAYEYGVNDDYSKANFKKTETQDANGVVAGSRQPSTPPTTSTALSLRSATRAPLSTLLSLLRDTVTLLPLLPMPLLPQCTSLLLKSNGANIQTLRNQIIPSSPPHPRP